jgi:L-glyceraldehyde 3-phosphate reductase
MSDHEPCPERYGRMAYRRCGSSGLRLPAISLGLWHNFGQAADDGMSRRIILEAFDHGITHFDLANTYGPPMGSAESRFGSILRKDLAAYRDELVLSSKAGYPAWPGPYGRGGSRKYLVRSCEQSLRRLGTDYLDIFYHHLPDPETPIAESMAALVQLVHEGKVLYAGISNYHPDEALEATRLLAAAGCPFVLNQVRYSLLDRQIEAEQLFDRLADTGIGYICFSPLAQGLLTDKYLEGTIPQGSRPTHSRFLPPDRISPAMVQRLNALDALAHQRGQRLAQMALNWVLRDQRVTAVLIGASSVDQLLENLSALQTAAAFTTDELQAIDALVLDAKS